MTACPIFDVEADAAMHDTAEHPVRHKNGLIGKLNALYDRYRIVFWFVTLTSTATWWVREQRDIVRSLSNRQQLLIRRDSVNSLRLDRIERRITIQAYNDCLRFPVRERPAECVEVIRDVREGIR